MSNTWFDCWSFVARVGAAPRVVGADRPLELASNFRVDTPTFYVGGETQQQASNPDGSTMQVDEAIIAILGHIDGQRSLESTEAFFE